MSRTLKSSLAIGATAAATAAVALASVTPAGAHVRHVTAGHSIQAAIDRARPGDTIVVGPGVYRENLTIMTSRITLRGAGDGPNGTVLELPARPHPSICSEFHEVTGICVTGWFKKGTEILGKPIVGTTVSGFAVRGFTRMGIIVYNARNTAILNNRASHSRHYGIVGFSLSGIHASGNVADANGQGGIHLADTGNARAVIERNAVYANQGSGGIGIYVRAASHGVIRNNSVHDNCAGILLANTERRPMTEWSVAGNSVVSNTRACSPVEGGGPPLSGIGVALLGTDGINVADNQVSGNHPTGTSPLFGGILVGSSRGFGGLDPSRNVVRSNRLSKNRPADLVYDGSGKGNRFVANTCRTSMPSGACR